MDLLVNPLKGRGISPRPDLEPGDLTVDPRIAMALFAQCPRAAATPLVSAPALAAEFGIATLYVKDERGRMGLGSFKALGAAYAIAKQAAKVLEDAPETPTEKTLIGQTYVCASAGNHGLSVAAGARVFGASAHIYLADSVPEAFAERLRSLNAQVTRAGAIYEEAMAAAARDAEAQGWQLLSDSSWLGYSAPARDVMEGYLIMTAEIADQIATPPSHIFLQAGVGGLAAASAAAARTLWGDDPKIIVVEPDAAPALIDSIRAERPVTTTGPVSCMGRLDCKEPSHLALAYLAREADAFMTITEDEARETTAHLTAHDLRTTPSGAAGIAGLQDLGDARLALGLDQTSTVLCYLSEDIEEA